VWSHRRLDAERRRAQSTRRRWFHRRRHSRAFCQPGPQPSLPFPDLREPHGSRPRAATRSAHAAGYSARRRARAHAGRDRTDRRDGRSRPAQSAPTHASNPLTSARSSVRTIRSNSRLGTWLLSSSVRAARAQWPDESRGSAGATGWAMGSCAATACSWRPSAPITLRIVSKPGLRSPERAL